MKDWKQHIYFVLVEPTEPGNIGASARAIKNMGFRNLCLVKPPADMSKEARWFARNAHDVLDSASVHGSVEEAISDKTLVVGTTRRKGKNRGVILTAEKGAGKIRCLSAKNKVAILFGREARGLYNDEVDQCNFMLTIPSSKSQPSLNLSQAVMIIAYELSKCGEKPSDAQGKPLKKRLDNSPLPEHLQTREALRYLYKRISSVLELLEYSPRGERDIMQNIIMGLKRFLGRTGLTESEMKMLLGLCTRIEKKLER